MLELAADELAGNPFPDFNPPLGCWLALACAIHQFLRRNRRCENVDQTFILKIYYILITKTERTL